MRNFIIGMWIIFAAFYLMPIGADFALGKPEAEVPAMIEEESGLINIEIQQTETHGDRTMFVFTTGGNFGAAIFSNIGDRYTYKQGTMSTNGKPIDVKFDSGMDIYEFKVTVDDIEEVSYKRFAGRYRTYGLMLLGLLALTIGGSVYSAKMKKKHEAERKMGLRK